MLPYLQTRFSSWRFEVPRAKDFGMGSTLWRGATCGSYSLPFQMPRESCTSIGAQAGSPGSEEGWHWQRLWVGGSITCGFVSQSSCRQCDNVLCLPRDLRSERHTSKNNIITTVDIFPNNFTVQRDIKIVLRARPGEGEEGNHCCDTLVRETWERQIRRDSE